MAQLPARSVPADQRTPAGEHLVPDPGADGDDAEFFLGRSQIAVPGRGDVVENPDAGVRPAAGHVFTQRIRRDQLGAPEGGCREHVSGRTNRSRKSDANFADRPAVDELSSQPVHEREQLLRQLFE